MKFRTIVEIPDFPFHINHKSRTLFVGSCFSDDIGREFRKRKFDCLVNPFGTLYNPLSVSKLLAGTLLDIPPDSKRFISRDDIWFHLDYHSDIWANGKQELAQNIREVHTRTKDYLGSAPYLFITLGTAVAFTLNKDSAVVANCHKMAPEHFTRRLLNREEVLKSLLETSQMIQQYNRNIQIIYTLSPVRHLRDGFSLNQVSKSILRTVIHKLTSDLEFVHYFPSYEIVLDELRDYRFYKEDLIHPNDMALKYIWDRCSECLFSASTKNLNKKLEKVLRDLNHKPLFPGSISHFRFLNDLRAKIINLQTEYKLDFSEEQSRLSKKITQLENLR